MLARFVLSFVGLSLSLAALGDTTLFMKALGLGFCCIAAFLYASRFLCAAIYVSGTQAWSDTLFKASYDYIGSDLTRAASISLVAGILFIVVGIIVDIFSPNRAA